MREKPRRQTVPVLALEVWLGPMEGLRRVTVLRSDPCIVRIGRGRTDEKRGLTNDLVLAEGDKISGFHAEVRFSAGALSLKDLNSTNGTYANGLRVSGEVEIRSGEVFLLSTTPVEALLEDEDATTSDAPMTDEQLAGVPFLQKMLAGVRKSTRKRGDNYADTRHLADALLRGSDPLIESSLRAGDFSADKALEELWGAGLYRGRSQWLCKFLQTPVEARRQEGEPVLSARVRLILGAAAKRLSSFPASEAESLAPGALLAGLLSRSGPVGIWLSEHRVAEPPLPEHDETSDRPTIRTPRISSTVQVPAEDVAMPRPSTSPMPAASGPLLASTGDVVLDQRARTIALQLEEVAAAYRFSTPEDRRSMMRTVVNRELAAVAPENRARILAQIRVQFPVIAAPQAETTGEGPRLQRRIEELEKRVRELKRERPAEEKKSQPTRVGPWQDVFSEGPVDRGAPAEVLVLREILDFASKMEKFLLGVIQAVTMPGNVTATFRLPAHRHTLESVLSAVRQGKPFDGERLPDYLRELERWQVAILAAHHESARIWFEKLWKKASPAAIEASTARSATWKIRGDAADWWNRYRDVVKGLSPEVVQDQVIQTAYRFALEEFEKLKNRRG